MLKKARRQWGELLNGVFDTACEGEEVNNDYRTDQFAEACVDLYILTNTCYIFLHTYGHGHVRNIMWVGLLAGHEVKEGQDTKRGQEWKGQMEVKRWVLLYIRALWLQPCQFKFWSIMRTSLRFLLQARIFKTYYQTYYSRSQKSQKSVL
jgi:hypothetical protein